MANHTSHSSPSEFERVALIGGGGHSLVVVEALLASGAHVEGVFDDSAKSPLADPDAPHAQWLGSIDEAVDWFAGVPRAHWVLTVGRVSVRRKMLEGPLARDDMRERACIPVTHATAAISPTSTLGPGVYVGPLAIVNTRAHVGAHSTVNSGAVVEHECRVGINAHVAPNANLGGRVTIGDHALLGTGATVLPGVKVGDGAIVGAGSVVTQDVAPGATVVGAPARQVS